MIYRFKCPTHGSFEASMSMKDDSSHHICTVDGCNIDCERDYDNINVNVATCFNGSYNSTRK